MADITEDRIQPCLFDRLIDDDPDSRQDTRGARVISLSRYREGVLRDLRWLLNSKSHLDAEDIGQFGEVAGSVLNFGMADLCGQLTSSLEASEIEHQILAAIKHFEPRIGPATLNVQAMSESEKLGPNMIGFQIEGQLWASPLPEQLYLKTKIDLETGQCVL